MAREMRVLFISEFVSYGLDCSSSSMHRVVQRFLRQNAQDCAGSGRVHAERSVVSSICNFRPMIKVCGSSCGGVAITWAHDRLVGGCLRCKESATTHIISLAAFNRVWRRHLGRCSSGRSPLGRTHDRGSSSQEGLGRSFRTQKTRIRC